LHICTALQRLPCIYLIQTSSVTPFLCKLTCLPNIMYKIHREVGSIIIQLWLLSLIPFRLFVFTVKLSVPLKMYYLNTVSPSHFKNAINELLIGNLNPLVVPRIRLIGLTFEGSRLTIQHASPVTIDRFDLPAKTNFSLARSLFTVT